MSSMMKRNTIHHEKGHTELSLGTSSGVVDSSACLEAAVCSVVHPQQALSQATQTAAYHFVGMQQQLDIPAATVRVWRILHVSCSIPAPSSFLSRHRVSEVCSIQAGLEA